MRQKPFRLRPARTIRASLNRQDANATARSRPIGDYLSYLLAQANRQLNEQPDSESRIEGVPVEQWRILKILAERDARPMDELAQAALLNAPSLTKTIDRMASQALVHRRVDPVDRRKVLIFISERDRALTERLNRLANSHPVEIVESWGDREARELRRLLEGLIQRTG